MSVKVTFRELSFKIISGETLCALKLLIPCGSWRVGHVEVKYLCRPKTHFSLK